MLHILMHIIPKRDVREAFCLFDQGILREMSNADMKGDPCFVESMT